MNKIKKLFRELISTEIFAQSFLTSSATLVNGLLGAVFYILMARELGPRDFGLFMVGVTTLTLISDIGNLGTDTGIVRLVSKYIIQDKDKALGFLRLSLQVRLAFSAVISIVGWFLAPIIGLFVFNKITIVLPLRVAFVGAGAFLLLSFSSSYFQALRSFWKWAMLNVGTNFIRLVIIFLLIFFGNFNLESGIWTYALIPLVGFIFSIFFLPKDIFKVKIESQVSHELFHYSKWVALFTVLAAISSRMDIFLSARLLSSQQVGYYSAADQLVAAIPQLTGALGVVVAPNMSGITKKIDFLNYFKKSQIFVLLLAFIGLLISPIIIFLIPLLYGSVYALALPSIFIILLIANLIFLISVPVHNAVFYYFSRPQLFVWLGALNLILTATIGYLLIQNMGAIGAAFMVLTINIINLVVPFIWFIRKIKA